MLKPYGCQKKRNFEYDKFAISMLLSTVSSLHVVAATPNIGKNILCHQQQNFNNMQYVYKMLS